MKLKRVIVDDQGHFNKTLQDKGNTSVEPVAKKRRKDEDQQETTSGYNKNGILFHYKYCI